MVAQIDVSGPSSPLPRCLHCGSENPHGFRFCGVCGNTLDLEGARSERRQVSVLFADLVGFTSWSEKRDSEEVRALLTDYFALARESIARYGGTVEKFIGDAVMAVWGSPVVHEDDPERSIRAALELVASVADLGHSRGMDDLNVRAGIMSGEAFVTLDAVGQGMVAGDLVNTAARLQSIADPGTVFVGRGTYRSAQGSFGFEEIATRVLKGRTGSTRVYRVAHPAKDKAFRESPQRLEPPFIGREDEMATLRVPLEAAVREERLHLAFLFGIGGIGKSRLVWELSQQATDFGEDVLWLQGRAAAYGEEVSLLPLTEILRSILDVDDSDGDDVISEKLTKALENFVTDDEERRWIERHLGRLLGLRRAGQGNRHELFAALRTFIGRVSGSGLTVLVLDDAQWAADTMFDFIDHLIDFDSSRRIVVLVLARPELMERRGQWLAGVSSSVSMSLGPLTDSDMNDLLTGMVSARSPHDFAPVVERADGVPLYAVETVKMLIDDGRIQPSEEGLALERPITELETPESLHALVTSRLDVLPSDEQTLIKDASVLGSSFSLAALSFVGDRSVEETRSLLRSLVRRRLIALDRDDPASPHSTVYGFIGGLVPEIAYLMLSRGDRFLRHRTAALYFASDSAEGDPTIAATHYTKALTHATEDESTSVAAQAKAAYELAAEHLVHQGSDGSALDYIRQALSLTGAGGDRARLHELAAELAARSSDPAAAEDHLLQTVEWYEQRSDPASLARVSARLGGIHLDGGDRHDGMQRLEAGLGTLVGMGALSSHPDNPHLAIVLAEALLTDGLFVQAGNWADQAMAGAEELGQPEVVAAALACKGKAAHAAGRWREAIGLLTGAQAMADELEFTNVQLGALLALSNVWQLVRPARALKEAQRALTLARRLGMPREETEAISAVSLLALLTEGRDGVERVSKGAQGTSPQQGITGAFRTVAEHVLDGELGMALDLLRKMQSETSISLESWIVEIRLLRQALAGEGRRAAAEALSTVRETGGYGNSARPYAQAGRAALWSHDPHGVEAALGAIDGFKPNGTPWVQLTKSALGAGLDSLTGSSPKTAAVYGRSIAQADEIGAAFDAALLQFDLGLLTASDETDSTEVMDEAERRFTQLGANGLWKRLDETTRDGWRTNGHV